MSGMRRGMVRAVVTGWRAAVVGAGCVVAMTVAGLPGPSAVAATPLGRPELSGAESQATVDVAGARLAGTQLASLRASQVAMDKLVSAANTEQADVNDAASGASGASIGGAAGAAVGDTGGKGGGSYAATPLAPSASWSAGGSSGSFSWSYPLRVVPSTGPTPRLEMTYDSGSVDGRLPSTNNQPSWVGEGFDLPTSYVERSYGSCADDKDTGQDANTGKYDLCWRNDNATLMLNGKASELVKTAKVNGVQRWRLKDDDASLVEQLTGANNGAQGGEYWRVTMPDGTRYSFGLNVLPGAGANDPRTNSVFTVPVFGDDVSEPCHGSSLKASGCVQGWRWNLDYVVDTHANAATYWYETEKNSYAQLGDVQTPKEYVRGGYLHRIRYGQRAGSLFSVPAGQQVEFGVGERCLAGVTKCAELTKSTHGFWPDVPFDALWSANTATARTGIVSPTFFTRKLLTSISTQVWNPATSAYRTVDGWSLKHVYLNPGDTGDTTDQSLWLSGIQQTTAEGKAALPAVAFTPIMMVNRVDAGADVVELTKPRIQTITSETGAVTVVNYSAADERCLDPDQRPAPKNNTLRCFPVIWAPNGGTDRTTDWFYKYVVADVYSADTTGGSPPIRYHYDYAGDAAWHHADDPVSPVKWRTWSQWRGYSTVTTLVGDATDEPQSKTVSVYLRGMNDDPGKTGTVTVNGVNLPTALDKAEPAAITDDGALAGFLREQITYNGTVPISGAWYEPWVHQTATYDFDADTPASSTSGYVARANFVRTRVQHQWTALLNSAGAVSAPRMRTSTTTFDTTYGMPTRVEDTGDTAVTTDQTCELTWYARNPDTGLTSLISRTMKLSTTCKGTDNDAIAAAADLPADATTGGDVISDTATGYDTATTWTPTQKPTTGNATWSGRAKGYASDATPSWQTVVSTTYDALGRALNVTNAEGKVSATTYTPADREPLTGTTATNPLKHASTTTYDPAWRVPLKVTDANNKVTEFDYDTVGRLIAVWVPPTHRVVNGVQDSANYRFGYHVSNSAPSWVSTSTLRTPKTGDSPASYITSYAIYDALLRQRQTQAPSPQGGRVINTTIYDQRGLQSGTDADIFDQDNDPNGVVAEPADQRAPAQTRVTFDGAGRAKATKFMTRNAPVWSTTTEYTGDSVATSAPEGGSATREYTDVTGQVVKRLKYKSTAFTGTTFLTTQFTYTPGGQIDTVTAPDKATWSYQYDLFGRQVSATDPDKGTTTSTYSVLDQVKTTNNVGKILAYDYDALGRKIALWSSTTRTKSSVLAAWTYDPQNALGQPRSSFRYVGGHPDVGGKAYTRTVTAFDDAYRPTAYQIVLPADDPLVQAGVPATLKYQSNYNLDGTLQSTSEPPVAGLQGETLSPGYNSLGMPISLGGREQIVLDTAYSPLGDVRQVGLGSTSRAANHVWITNKFQTGTRRLLSSDISDGTHAWFSQNVKYGYDTAGNVTSVFDTAVRDGSGKADYQCFDYDGYQQLTNAWTPASAGATPADTCNVSKRSTAALGGPAPYWSQYTYKDTSGQRATEVKHESNTTVTYTYDTAHPHQLKTTTTTVGSGNTAKTTTSRFGYDAAGNTTSRTSPSGPQTLDWDNEGHLVSSTITGNGVTKDQHTTNIYDPEGTLLIRRPTSGDGKTTLYLGATEVTLTTNGSAATLSGTRYYTHLGKQVAVRTTTATGTKLSWLAGDRNGTAEVAMDRESMAVTRRYTGPFGTPRGTTTGSAPTSWIDDKGFLGKPEDPAAGLVHVGAREYDPAIGQFISVDPVLDTTDPLSLNGYTYANNSPVTFSDPTGLSLGVRPTGYQDPLANSGFAQDLGLVDTQPGAPRNSSASSPPPAAPASQDHGGGGGGFLGWAKKKVGQARQWSTAHADLIVDVAVGIGAGIAIGAACVATIGVGCAIAAAVGGGVLGAMAGYGTRVASGAQEFSWTDLGTSAAVGAASGLTGHGIGKAIAKALPSARPLLSFAKNPKSSGARAASAGLCSFAGATAVLMGDGSTKPIKDIRTGDKVTASDPRTGERAAKTVSKVWIHPDTVVDLVIDGHTITTTEDHPFWNATDNEYQRADQLDPGDHVLDAQGQALTVTGLRVRSTRAATAYNLTVQDLHTYHVGPANILVHNCPMGAKAAESASGLRTAAEAGIRQGDALRIQNAATKTGQRITVVGSRAGGTATPTSDWDYILSGPSRARSRVRNSLPSGVGGGDLPGRGLDLFQDYNPAARYFTELDPSLPHVIFNP